MPVFDFNDVKDARNHAECTYTTFNSRESMPTPEKPILLLDNQKCQWKHHSCGVFTNPVKRSSFEFEDLCWQYHAGKYPSVGQKKSGGCPFS